MGQEACPFNQLRHTREKQSRSVAGSQLFHVPLAPANTRFEEATIKSADNAKKVAQYT
jgi:hypothetical protein